MLLLIIVDAWLNAGYELQDLRRKLTTFAQRICRRKARLTLFLLKSPTRPTRTRLGSSQFSNPSLRTANSLNFLHGKPMSRMPKVASDEKSKARRRQRKPKSTLRPLASGMNFMVLAKRVRGTKTRARGKAMRQTKTESTRTLFRLSFLRDRRSGGQSLTLFWPSMVVWMMNLNQNPSGARSENHETKSRTRKRTRKLFPRPRRKRKPLEEGLEVVVERRPRRLAK